MAGEVSWRTLAAWAQGDRMDEDDEQPYENHTPNLGVLLDVLEKKAPTLVTAARKELRYLKVQHAKLLLDYYAEYNGVPNGCWEWSDDEILAWAEAEYQRVAKL
jgi:hypothetical protein